MGTPGEGTIGKPWVSMPQNPLGQLRRDPERNQSVQKVLTHRSPGWVLAPIPYTRVRSIIGTVLPKGSSMLSYQQTGSCSLQGASAFVSSKRRRTRVKGTSGFHYFTLRWYTTSIVKREEPCRSW